MQNFMTLNINITIPAARPKATAYNPQHNSNIG